MAQPPPALPLPAAAALRRLFARPAPPLPALNLPPGMTEPDTREPHTPVLPRQALAAWLLLAQPEYLNGCGGSPQVPENWMAMLVVVPRPEEAAHPNPPRAWEFSDRF